MGPGAPPEGSREAPPKQMFKKQGAVPSTADTDPSARSRGRIWLGHVPAEPANFKPRAACCKRRPTGLDAGSLSPLVPTEDWHQEQGGDPPRQRHRAEKARRLNTCQNVMGLDCPMACAQAGWPGDEGRRGGRS